MKGERRTLLRPLFVDSVPDASLMEPDALYVSMTYATAIHKCACGCDNETVTPLAPDEWSLSYDGETISLTPSVGNSSLKCKSHYWIRGNKIEWVADEERRLLVSLWRKARRVFRRTSERAG